MKYIFFRRIYKLLNIIIKYVEDKTLKNTNIIFFSFFYYFIGFTLSELVISRSLRQSDDTSSNKNTKGVLTDQERTFTNRPIQQEIIQEANTVIIPVSACSDIIPNESNRNAISSQELSVSAKEIQQLQKLGMTLIHKTYDQSCQKF